MAVVRASSIAEYLMAAAALWIAISVAMVVFSSRLWFLLLRIKLRMTRFDETMTLPLFDRRQRRRTVLQLRLTRRPIMPREGKILEKLNHAIDYLIDTYNLRKFSEMSEELRPAEFVAVLKLLQCRAEMLKSYPPLPSFSYLAKRRLAYLMNRKRTWV